MEKRHLLYSLGSKFLIATVTILVIVMSFATLFGISIIRKNIHREMEGHLKADLFMSRFIIKNRLEEIEYLANLSSADNTIRVTVDLGVIPQLEEHLKRIVTREELDFFIVTDTYGLSVSCADDVVSKSIILQEQISKAFKGHSNAGIVLIKCNSDSDMSSGQLMMTAVSPIRIRGEIIGVLSLGKLLKDDAGSINLMKENTKADVVIWQNEEGVIASSFSEDEADKFHQSFEQLLTGDVLEKMDTEQIFMTDLKVDRRNFLLALQPLKDFKNKTIAITGLYKSMEDLKSLETETVRNMIIISLSGVFVAVILITYITKTVSRPIQKTVEAMTSVTERDDLSQHVDVKVKGEVGKLVKAFNKMVSTIKESRAAFQEITDTLDQKVKERTRKLEEIQKKLVNKALEAGRAQLSAMVLHNIGNAITPIKIYLDGMKADELDKMTLYLEKCYLDLSEHTDVLQQYINDDPRGKEIFSYMSELICSLKDHGKQNKKNVEKIDGAISYISEILTLQQAYAASEHEVKERVDLNMLIENAIRMQAGSLKNRGIIIKKDLAYNLQKLLIDKNRLMQVIVNLIKNSYEAIDEIDEIDEMNDQDREKVIRFKSFSENGRIGFEIIDNGTGIDPEQINKIFEFGKSHKGSSGFGLYYCNMFVQANNGKMEFNSPGPGKGASVRINFGI